MRLLKVTILIIGMLGSVGQATAGNALFANTALYQNQALESIGGQYSLWMQDDGNLVMYRKDGTVRWSTAQTGSISIMQGDGNFVLYTASYSPMFSTGTWGNPGSFLAVQDDGNLVIYGPDLRPLWWIGVDAKTDDPQSPGDVVGRDIDLPVLGPVGHIGVWDGSNVVQAMIGLPNAIEFVSLKKFKAASRYWGAAKPNVPFGFMYSYCYFGKCTDNGADYVQLSTRIAIAERARQIQAIGADYTLIPEATIAAAPEYSDRPARRGKYRCDTFVLDTYRFSTYFWDEITAEQREWTDRVRNLSKPPLLPSTVFDRLRTFN